MNEIHNTSIKVLKKDGKYSKKMALRSKQLFHLYYLIEFNLKLIRRDKEATSFLSREQLTKKILQS